ncbi:MAG: ArnT family glycosyltransferase [Acidobacteriota bacterium]
MPITLRTGLPAARTGRRGGDGAGRGVPSSASSGPLNAGRAYLLMIALLLALGLSFQGTRGIWEPDEGFYVNVAKGLLDRGELLIPRLNGEIFLDKPPLIYWGMIASIRAFGLSEWSVRLPHALYFIGTALLICSLGTRLWDRSTGIVAAVVYSTTLAPFLAANVLTPDTPLAAFVALFFLSYWRATTSDGSPRRPWWWLLAGAAVGLGVLAKGPAMMVFVAPAVAHLVWTRGARTALATPMAWWGAAVALLVGLPWYLYVVGTIPGAGDYILDNEIVGRLFTARYRRHPQWYGALLVYIPMLTFGALPWSVIWIGKLGRLFRDGPRRRATRRRDPARAMLLLWLAIPACVLLLARSRLYLYVLPLYAPAALLTARGLKSALESAGGLLLSRRCALLLLAWSMLLVGLKLGASHWGGRRDTRAVARALDRELGSTPVEVVAVDLKLNALPFYGFDNFEWVTRSARQYPYYASLRTLDDRISTLPPTSRPVAFILTPDRAAETEGALTGAGADCRAAPLTEFDSLLLCKAAADGSGAAMAARVNRSKPIRPSEAVVGIQVTVE